MTVWNNSIVIFPGDENANADAGVFYAVGGNGQLPVPHHDELASYPISTLFGGGGGGTIAGQTGSFTIA